MIGTGESSVAKMTLEWSVSGVFAVMACQFIRTGELPAAPLPVAVVRLLSGMGAHVGLQVRALGVGLATARVCTGVGGGALAAPGAATLLTDDLRGTRGLWGWHVGVCWGVTEQVKERRRWGSVWRC